MHSFKLKCQISNLVENIVDLDSIIRNKRGRYILAYHRLLPYELTQREYIQSCMWTTPQSFENQLRWMAKIGEIVDIERILDFEKYNEKPLFSITFDDGWKDNYIYAFPILKKYKITATIFLVTSAVNTGQLLWPDEVIKKTNLALRNNRKQEIKEFIKSKLKHSGRGPLRADIFEQVDYFLEHLKELSIFERQKCIDDYYTQIEVDSEPFRDLILSWDEILEMDKYGISFGSHTHSHAILQYCDERKIMKELSISKTILEEKLKKPIYMFCYPNARYNDSDSNLLEKAGYKFGFRLHNLPVNSKSSMYFIPRISVDEKIYRNPSYFKFKLFGVPRY